MSPFSVHRLRRLVAISGWPFADQGMVSFSNFLCNVVIARGLGAAQFGIFVLGWSAVLLALSAQLALVTSPMYSLGPRRAVTDANAYFGALFLQECLLIGVAFVLLYGGAIAGSWVFVDWPFSEYALPLSVAGALYLWQDFIRRCLFARHRPAAAFLSDVISYPCQLAILVAALKLGTNLTGVLWIIAATSGVSAAVGIAYARPLRWEARRLLSTLVEHWRFARWLFATTVLQSLMSYTFIAVAGTMLGVAAVGGLRAAWLVLAVTNVLYLGFENFLPQRAAEVLRHLGIRLFKVFLLRWTLVSLSCSLTVSLIATAMPSFWMRLFFGESLSPYANLIYGNAVYNVLVSLGLMVGIALRSAEATHAIFRATTASVAFGLLTIVPLVRECGIWGPIIAGVGAQATSLAFLTWDMRRVFAHALPEYG